MRTCWVSHRRKAALQLLQRCDHQMRMRNTLLAWSNSVNISAQPDPAVVQTLSTMLLCSPRQQSRDGRLRESVLHACGKLDDHSEILRDYVREWRLRAHNAQLRAFQLEAATWHRELFMLRCALSAWLHVVCFHARAQHLTLGVGHAFTNMCIFVVEL